MIYLILAAVGGAFFFAGPLMERSWLPVRRQVAGMSDLAVRGPSMVVPTTVRRTTGGLKVVRALARREARRLLLHPVMVMSVLLSAWWGWAVRDGSPTDTYNNLTGGFHILITIGVLGCLVVHLTVSAPRRADLEEQFTATPVSDLTRTLALLVGCLAPAAVSALVLAFTWLAVDRFSDTVLLREPSLWAYAGAPLTVLGGLLLGVLLGRWVPWRGASFPALFLVIGALYLLAENIGHSPFLAPSFDRAVYDKVGVYESGSEPWHFAYIGGLCVMASIGALLRSPGRYRDRLLGFGAVAVLATAYAGWAQLA